MLKIKIKKHIWVLLILLWATPAQALMVDTEVLSQRIADSVSKAASRKYATVAFSRISGPIDAESINELIDFTNVALVKNRSFRVVDRSKLQLILQEQKFNLSGMVSQDEYKELGKLLGVDLFIYGRYYQDTLVMKAIDVESSALIWADIFQLTALTEESLLISELAEKMNASLEKDLKRLKASGVQQVSFWNVQFDDKSNRLVDFLSVAITKQGHFQVIDRENLKLLLSEQKLNQAEFIDENKAKKMGELYGVDAFIYGSVSRRGQGYMASLKMLNIFNGVIEWADLIRFGTSGSRGISSSSPAEPATVVEEMVEIPRGPFKMGSNQGPAASSPEFEITLNSYWIDRTEVSNQDYAQFVKKYGRRTPPHWVGGIYPPGEERQPVVMVTWEDAELFCKSLGKRLPKETEWEKAFRGPEALPYPWGEKFDSTYVRTVESGIRKALPVDERNGDLSPYGLMHMAGNVREWVASSLEAYPGSNYTAREIGVEKVIRGGSWAENKFSALGYHRGHGKRDYAWQDVGFRCAK